MSNIVSSDLAKTYHEQTTIKDVKKGDLVRFTIGGRVYIRGDYDRTEKKYELTSWDDASRAIYKKAATKAYIGFTF